MRLQIRQCESIYKRVQMFQTCTSIKKDLHLWQRFSGPISVAEAYLSRMNECDTRSCLNILTTTKIVGFEKEDIQRLHNLNTITEGLETRWCAKNACDESDRNLDNTKNYQIHLQK